MAFPEDDEIRTPSPFTPAPKKNQWPLALLTLVILLMVAASYWWQRLADPVRDVTRSISEPSAMPGAHAPMAVPRLPATSLPLPPAPAQAISKCVLKGKTTYSDGPCPVGAKAEQLAVRADMNVMQAPAVEIAQSPGRAVPARSPAPLVVQASPPAGQELATCLQLERRIEELDALARQPQSGQMQDWITAEKRKARDRQFRLKC